MSRFAMTAGALFTLAVVSAVPASGQTLSCSATNVRCVDDTSGSTQEYSTIQAAVTAAVAGDTILVHNGTYKGVEVSKSGTSSSPIVLKAAGTGAVISTPASTGDGVYLRNVSYVTVEGFKIQNMSSSRCIAARESSATAPMRGLTIRNNTCSGAGIEGFYLSQVSNSLVEGNSISDSGRNGAGRGHGMYLANAGSDNTTVRGNTIFNLHTSESAGLHINGDLSIGGDGLVSGLLIERNTFYDVDFNAISMDGVQSSTIQNNLMYDIGKNAVRAFMIDGAQGPKNLRLINNTFLTAGWGFKASEDGGGHVVFNNIMLATGSNGGSICVDNSNITSDYNALSNRLSRNNEASILSLASWQSGGDDAHSFQGSSSTLFVNAAGNDYHRKDGGPAVDEGAASLASVAAPGNDRDGKGRPLGGAHDLGAYESATAGGSTTPPPPAAPTNLRILR